MVPSLIRAVGANGEHETTLFTRKFLGAAHRVWARGPLGATLLGLPSPPLQNMKIARDVLLAILPKPNKAEHRTRARSPATGRGVGCRYDCHLAFGALRLLCGAHLAEQINVAVNYGQTRLKKLITDNR